MDADTSASCPGGGDQIINCTAQSTSGGVLLPNVTVCAAGQNEVIYDIGFLDANGLFVASAVGVFSADITVVPGSAVVLRLVLRNSTVQRTYSQISSVVGVVLQDQGRNVTIIIFFEYAFKRHTSTLPDTCIGCPRLNFNRIVGRECNSKDRCPSHENRFSTEQFNIISAPSLFHR